MVKVNLRRGSFIVTCGQMCKFADKRGNNCNISEAAMPRDRVEFFYDLSSPWTYLAFTNLQDVLARTGATARLRPILVGGVFNAVNQSVYAAREATDNRKLKHSWRVLKDWAALTGVELRFPSQYHPAKSVNAMRMACTLGDDMAAL
eukprot:gene27992-49757_t